MTESEPVKTFVTEQSKFGNYLHNKFFLFFFLTLNQLKKKKGNNKDKDFFGNTPSYLSNINLIISNPFLNQAQSFTLASDVFISKTGFIPKLSKILKTWVPVKIS